MKKIGKIRLSRCAAGTLACAIVLAVVKADAGSVTYKYDNAGRLRAAVYDDASSVAYNLDPAGNRKTVVVVGPDTTPPSVPGNFSATSGAYNTASLSWSASIDNPGGSGLAGYYIYRWSPPSSSSRPQIGTASATATTYNDTNLTGSTTYSYGVAAYDLAGNVSAMTTTSVTTPAAPPPTAPTGLTATAWTATQVVLTWTASIDTWGPGVGAYVVYRNGTAIATTAANTTGYTDNGLSANTTYSYTVASRDTLGYPSPQSGVVSVTTPANYVDNLTMTEGSATNSDAGFQVNGYYPPGVGQISPSTLTGGKTLAFFYDQLQVGFSMSCIEVNGFSSDPGQAWLASATALGVTQSGSTAQYSYQAGYSTWCWNSAFGFAQSGTIPVSIIHQP